MDYKEWAVGVESLKAAFKASENRFSPIKHLIGALGLESGTLVMSSALKQKYDISC